ncbi:glycosyltransferase family 4 protein [Fulvivirga lutimaris]|uniref:glycosyltransferase family 4 protein n=1 Tax=Fulvivirga lutimaris TaxID=1819566 RepID=UPI0012BD7800|nr:glycosyltransferase family 4 protein [Fulvivirga lutimaris]MTI39516.1 glycosyltransferase family 1 protein [Fulvivirga lutimaris]
MRILHISSEKSWRGGEQQIAYLLDETAEAGVNNEVLCREGSSFELHCKKYEIPYHAVSFSGVQLFSTAFTLKRLAENFDIIHAHTAKAHLLCYYALSLGMTTKVVVSRRVDFVPSSSFFTRKRYNHLGISKYLCVSKAIENIMKSYLDEGKDRCTTVYSGVDLKKFGQDCDDDLHSEFGLDKSLKLVVNTSALADHKDYFTFLDTAKIISDKRSDVHFIVFGDGPMKEEIIAYAHNLNLDRVVTFAGFVDNVPSLLPHADVFLITSKTEGLGTSIIDAFACKVPVIATAAGGIPELVEDHKTGLLNNVGDSASLADSIDELLNNDELVNKLTAAATVKLQRFTKENTAKATMAVYKELIEN